MAMCVGNRNYLTQNDLERFLTPEEAAEAFTMLDVDQDGRVTLREMRSTIVSIYKVSIGVHASGLTS